MIITQILTNPPDLLVRPTQNFYIEDATPLKARGFILKEQVFAAHRKVLRLLSEIRFAIEVPILFYKNRLPLFIQGFPIIGFTVGVGVIRHTL